LKNLRHRTLTGLTWSGAAQIGRQIIQFVVSVLLARLLTPNDFGLFSMIIVFTGFAELFNDVGLGAAIIQRSDVNRQLLNSVFWTNVLIGILLTVITAFAAPFLSSFYNEPLLKNLTTWISINFFINSLCIVQTVLLQKRIDFRRLAYTEMLATIISGIISVSMALSGFGVWSLVAQSVTFAFFYALMLWTFSTWQPKLSFDWQALKGLLRFSTHLFGFNVFNYWVRNMDNLLIGKVIGSSALGIYSRAYSLMLLPVSQISTVMGRVMFPALSIIQKDTELTKKVYLNSTRIIALISFPFITALLITAEPLILLLYGEKWSEIIPIFRILCITGIGQTVGTTLGWIYTSQGRTDIMFKWGMLSGFIYIISFVIGIHWGIIGIATAYVLSGYLILWYPAWAIPGRLINLRFGEMLKNLAGPFYCTMLMGTTMLLMHLVIPSTWPHGSYLAVQLPFGILVYYLCIKGFRLTAYNELKMLIKEHIVLSRGDNTI
jgi:O-antigen/teichoic acid export membrane protein